MVFKKTLKMFLIAVGVFLVVIYVPKEYLKLKAWMNTSICDTPLTYRIGSIDSGFDLSKEELKQYVEEAATRWRVAYGKDLFVYDPESQLDINMIYDERQEGLEDIEDFESNIELNKYSIEEQERIYDQKLNDFKSEVGVLNEEIDYWNSKGGAPEDKYNELIKRQDEVARKAEELNIIGAKLNDRVNKVNQEIEDLNDQVNGFNDLLSSKPEVGYYTSGEHKIDVFFYSDKNYLVDVLTHEMGHAIGLDHIDEPGAIMNPTLTENTLMSQADVELLKNYCEGSTRSELIKYNLQIFVINLLTKLGINNSSI